MNGPTFSRTRSHDKSGILESSVNFSFLGGITEFSHALTTIAYPTIQNTNRINCWIELESNLDHDPDDVWVENLTCYAGKIVPGVSFDIIVRAPNNSWGRYNVYAEVF